MRLKNEEKNPGTRRTTDFREEKQTKQQELKQTEQLSYSRFEISYGFGIADESDISGNVFVEELESFDPVNFPVDEIEMISLRVFNPMRYNVRRSYLKRKYYRLGRTGKILVLFSGEELRKKFREKFS